MDPRKVHVGELTRLVALGQLRSLEPGNGLLELALLHQVTPYVVVGVSEVGIHFDGLQAFCSRLVKATLEAIGPPEERVGLGGRAHLDRAPIELDRRVELALHLAAVSLPPELCRPLEALRLAHRVTKLATPPGENRCPRTTTRSSSAQRSDPSSNPVRAAASR